MKWTSKEILRILDNCCDAYTFPMLDNGYVYPAATRLAVFHSAEDWALVIEVFGYSPRAGYPDTSIHTFGSRIHNRKTSGDFVSVKAYEQPPDLFRRNGNPKGYLEIPIDPEWIGERFP